MNKKSIDAAPLRESKKSVLSLLQRGGVFLSSLFALGLLVYASIKCIVGCEINKIAFLVGIHDKVVMWIGRLLMPYKIFKIAWLFVSLLLLMLLFRYIKFVVSIAIEWVKLSIGGVFYSVLSIVKELFVGICKVDVWEYINCIRNFIWFLLRWIWEPLAWCLRIINIAFCYVSNKHLSILFGAMLVVVIGVAGIIRYTSLLGCIRTDTSDIAYEKKQNSESCNKEMREVKFSHQMMWVIDRMFSYEKVRANISGWNNHKAGDKLIAVIAFGLFLFTWFVGGGVLVSALIATTIDIWSGKWRVWGILLRNHTVILGWDDTVPVLLKEHVESHKSGIFNFCRPETIVIMTEYPAHKVRSALRDVLCKPLMKDVLRWPFAMVSTVVCNGKFDDKDEIRGLCLQRANSIYVVGEMNDPSHDIRVLMAPAKIHSYSNSLLQRPCFQFDERRLNCHLNIRSLHLFWQHIRGEAKLGDNRVCCRQLNIVPHNFYDSWMKRLFSRVPLINKHHFYDSWVKSLSHRASIDKNDKNDKNMNLHFAFRGNCDSDIHLVIVGFGYFGQALAVEAASIAHYGTARRTYITVIDDDIGEKERDFRALFPKIDEITDVYLSFITDVKIGSEKFRELLKVFARSRKTEENNKDRNQQLTIALTLEDDEACLKQVLPVYKAMIDVEAQFQLIVSQQSCETDLNFSDETFVGMYGCKEVKFFGFCNGAGFGAWRRERHARETFSSPEHNYYKWYNLGERSRQYRRMMFDCIEEQYRDKNKKPDIMGVAKAACLLHGIEMSEEEINECIDKFKTYYNKTFS